MVAIKLITTVRSDWGGGGKVMIVPFSPFVPPKGYRDKGDTFLLCKLLLGSVSGLKDFYWLIVGREIVMSFLFLKCVRQRTPMFKYCYT